VHAVDQHLHQRGNVGRVGADAGRRDQRLEQRLDRLPDAMGKGFAPAGNARVGFDLDQQRLEGVAPLAGEFRLGRARLELLAIDDAREARNFHGNFEPGRADYLCSRRLSLSWPQGGSIAAARTEKTRTGGDVK
jgi:hypothetical protein